MELKYTVTDLFLCFPPYLQIYYYDEKILTYKDLTVKVLISLKNNKELEDIVEFLKTSKIKAQSYQKYKDNLNLEFKDFFTKMTESLHDFFDNITFISKNNLSFLSSTYKFNQKIIFYNEDPLFLLIDELIMTNYFKQNSISNDLFSFSTNEELLSIISKGDSPKRFIVMNQEIRNLLPFNSLGTWTILLTPIVFSYFDIEESHEIHKIIKENCEYLKYNNKFFSFFTTNFNYLAFYYNEIAKINNNDNLSNNANQSVLTDLIDNKLRPIRVLVILRTLMRSRIFLKQKYFVSSDKVLYYSHIGGDNISINNEKFDFILAKAVELQDSISYSKLFENMISYSLNNNIRMINDLRNIKWFIEKDFMGDFLSYFVNCEDINKILHKHNVSLRFPKSMTLDLKDLLDKEIFLQYLKENNKNFPLIIKYKGNSHFFKHLVSFVFEEKYLDDFIKYLREIEIPEESLKNSLLKTKCIIQEFINHEGHVLKFYRLAKENFLDYRSSLPDLNEGFLARHASGYWNFKTCELESDEFKKISKTFHSSSQIVEILNENEGFLYNVLSEIVCEFEKFSNFTLFGLDFLYDTESHKRGERIFYIVDCNSLPAFKIKAPNFDVAEYLQKHFVSYYNKNN